MADSGQPRSWWGRKVARLPKRGILLFATDLQGNFGDYERLKTLYFREKARGTEPVLLLCGDLVHGPGESLAHPDSWPDFLGSFYLDRSVELVLDFMEFARHERVLSLMGNHEHAHVGGPRVSKFHADEAAVLEDRLGRHAAAVREFFSSLPLLAVSSCGVVFTHGAPRVSPASLESFESMKYDGYADVPVLTMAQADPLGALLWSRHAEPEQARAFLRMALPDRGGAGFVAYGHDVVREGYERTGDEQLCLSTSFGCRNECKYYLRLDLSARYDSAHDLAEGRELLRLYPEA